MIFRTIRYVSKTYRIPIIYSLNNANTENTEVSTDKKNMTILNRNNIQGIPWLINFYFLFRCRER